MSLVDNKRFWIQEDVMLVSKWNFEKECKSKQIEKVCFVLLTDLLFFCEKKNEFCLLKEFFPLDNTLLVDVEDNSSPQVYGKQAKNIFELHRKDTKLRYVVFCNQKEQKSSWISSITSAIKTGAIN